MPVLDTTFVVDCLRGDDKAARLLTMLSQGTRPLGVAPFTLYELYRGVGMASMPAAEQRKVDAMLHSFITFPFEPEAAKAAGILGAEAVGAGKPFPVLDLFIGCIAVHHRESVVTRNAKDFRRIPGLEVLAY